MLFRLSSLSLSAKSLTFSESFFNANYASFINFINFRVYRNECTVAKILIKIFLLANNFGTGNRIKFDCWNYQRWSRGHKARGQGQGQGHKKNPRPRPRTALPRTEPLEAKDRNARGQGQGPRTQAQVFSKKKVFKNFFQAISNSLACPEFIGISLNHKSNEMTSSKFFQRGSFCGINIS